MASHPPNRRTTPNPDRIRTRLLENADPRDDGSLLFFSVEGAPLTACRTTCSPGGGITFSTSFAGRVTASTGDQLELHSDGMPVRFCHFLPSAVDLRPLLGGDVSMTVHQSYRASGGRATIDAEVRDEAGLLLWAHDGRFPEDRACHGLVLRRSVGPDGEESLAISHAAGLATVRVGEHALVELEGERGNELFAVLLVRLGNDDLSWVLVQR